MTSVLWPGDDRAGTHMTPAAVISAVVDVEDAWLKILCGLGVASEYTHLTKRVDDQDVSEMGANAEAGGNLVIPLVGLLRDRLRVDGRNGAAVWVHRGLTSQDVLDTALMRCARDAVAEVRVELTKQVELLSLLVDRHRDTPMVARTLTQAAVPTTFGAKAASWLHSVLDAAEALSALTFPVQFGGAAATLSGVVEIAGLEAARTCRAELPAALGLIEAPPWHTRRTPVTKVGDALVTATDAWGRIANDVLVLGRPEIRELAEPTGGGSSTMPQKANPTLSVLIRRAALAGPGLAATLHIAAAEQVDERADGAWHVEWDTLAVLVRRTITAASQTTAVIAGLQVDEARMASHLADLSEDLHAEQRTLAAVAGHDPRPDYFGLVADLVDEAKGRARSYLKDNL